MTRYLILIVMIIFSCSQESLTDEQLETQKSILLELAKKDVIKRLIHPEGTVFIDSTAKVVQLEKNGKATNKWEVWLEGDTETLAAGRKRGSWTLKYRKRRWSSLKETSFKLESFD